MADEKVNVGPEERKTPETPAPSGPGDPPAPEHTEGPAGPGGDQAAPAHVEPATPEQSVIPGMGEDAPAPSGKVINLSDIQAADKGSKEASAPAPDKKAPETDKPPKRRGRPPKEQAGPTAEKKSKAAEPRTGRPSKVDKAAREEAPPSVRDKVSRGKKADKGKETGSGGAPASKSAKAVKPGKAAPVKEAAVPPPEIKLPPTPEVPPRPVEEGKIVYLKMSELHPFHTFREHPYKVQDDITRLSGAAFGVGRMFLWPAPFCPNAFHILNRHFWTFCPEVARSRKGGTMDKNQGYSILKAVMLENGRGFALGHHPTAPSPYVTWACYDDEKGQRQYEWGHYGNDLNAMEKDFAGRVQDYQRLFKVKVVKCSPKVGQKLCGKAILNSVLDRT